MTSRKHRRRRRQPDGKGNGRQPSRMVKALAQAMEHLQAGAPDQAMTVLEAVLALQPGDPEALNLLGIASFESGDPHRAETLFRLAIDKAPEFVDARNNLGNALRSLGKFDDARRAYQSAIEIQPLYLDAHYNLGVVLEAMDLAAEAEDSYRHALSLRPDFAPAYLNLGNIFRAAGRLAEAEDAYQSVLTVNPGQPDALSNLGGVLFEQGRLEDAQRACEQAVEVAPNHLDAHYNLGINLQEQGHLDAALGAYGKVIELMPDYAPAHINSGYALHKLGRADESEQAYLSAIKLDPGNVQAHTNLGDLYLDRGNPEAALSMCEEYLRQFPGNSGILAFKAVTLNELGKHESVQALLDFDRLFVERRFPEPPGFASPQAFNEALASQVLEHPALVDAPASHATRHGKHSGELLRAPEGPMRSLEQFFRDAIDGYRESLRGQHDHPFTTARPDTYQLTAWAVVLGEQGYQLPHIHPSAWLSGVYYVQVPEVVADAGDDHAGWIEFGRPPAHFHCGTDFSTHCVQPQVGKLLLFPSYFYHRTIPFTGEGQRISIAFDVLPDAIVSPKS